jgi:hypothetical protein
MHYFTEKKDYIQQGEKRQKNQGVAPLCAAALSASSPRCAPVFPLLSLTRCGIKHFLYI